MLSRFWTAFLISLSGILTIAWLVALMHEKDIRPVRDMVGFFKKQPKTGRVVFGIMFLAFWLVASIKPDGGGSGGDSGGDDGGGTNSVQSVQMVVSPGSGLGNVANVEVLPITSTNAQLEGTAQLGNGNIGTGNISTLATLITSTNTTRTITGDDFRRGFVMSCVGTGEAFDFSAPSNAVVCADWRAFGAATDWIYVALTNWAFRVTTNDVDRLRIYAFGKIEPQIMEAGGEIATNYWFAPFMASLGIARQANWDWLAESDRPSQLWHCVTPSNTLQITWQNALLDRDTDTPLSFQAEYWTDGRFTYRYDLSRCGGRGATAQPGGVLMNVVVGAAFAGNEWTTNAIPTNVTSMTFYPLSAEDAVNPDPDNDGLATIDELFVYHTDPRHPDSDYDGLTDYEELFIYHTDPLDPYSAGGPHCDGLAVKIGDLDPFACPEGSTNTVLEHIFYSGTTNGAFAYPQSDTDTAILKVMVSGSGTGRLVVGDSVVPLVAPPQMRSGTATNILLLTVGRGVRREVWFDRPEGLDVAVKSDDFLIGEMPLSLWPHGWLAFPHTEATAPCIHDFNTRAKSVTLVHGEEFPGMTATWDNGNNGDVVISNAPPVSAVIGGSFPKDAARAISYTLDHPNRLNDHEITIAQQLRFCPAFTPEYETNTVGVAALGDSDSPDVWIGDDPTPYLPDDDVDAEEAFTNIVGGALSPLYDVLYLYRDNTRTEYLEVPNGPARECCPCPEHRNTNYVAKVSYTGNVDVRDAAGNVFEIAHRPCTVTLSGTGPSYEFYDSPVLFVTNGAPYKVNNYTVLGVGFKSGNDRPAISNYNQRSSSFGYPVAVCTNLDYANSIILKTDVLLSDGVVRVSLEDTSGDVELWLPEWWDWYYYTWRPAEPLLQAGGRTVRYFTIQHWRNIMRRYDQTRQLPVRVVSSRPSRCKVKIEFAASDGEYYVYDHATQWISTVMPMLLPDYNRDGTADVKDALDSGNLRTLYFWANDDTWTGDDAFAAYGDYNAAFHPWPITLPSNGDDMVVNGRNDLVNLCPFAVNLASFVREWGTNDVRYVFYTGSPGSVRFVPVQTKWNRLNEIVTKEQKTIYGDNLHSATLQSTARNGYGAEVGYDIRAETMELNNSGAGILAVEFVSIGECNLRVEAVDVESGETLFKSSVMVKALDVHRMYRWLNLESACGASTDSKYDERLSVQWPDSEHADANVVFVHGYNVHPSEAWDWSQAMFKRLWWSGMDAGFTAVLWRGNESQLWISHKKCYATRNYHQNVLNAFRTADAFASQVNTDIPGAKKYMIAHSLGNMLVSAARQFHGLQYEKYFMLNAAVPIEAYDPDGGVTTTSKNDMTPPEWRPYPGRVRATHWHELFLSLPSDARTNLTWKGLFKDVDRTINFYSSKDEVVANGNDDVDEVLARDFAWYNQEHLKGYNLVSFTPQAGWVFSEYYQREEFVTTLGGEQIYVHRLYTPEETATITDDDLMAHPFFRGFMDGRIYGEGGSEFVRTNSYVRWYALSHGIPAESFAVGANPVPKWGTPVQGRISRQSAYSKGLIRNVNMARNCVPDTGEDDANEDDTNEDDKELPWIHSYFIGNSLFDTAVLYDAIVKQIGSTNPKEVKKNE